MSGKNSDFGCTTKSHDTAKDLEAGVNDPVPVPTFNALKEVENEDQNLVDFCGNDDPADPLNWEPIYKWSIVVLISTISAVA